MGAFSRSCLINNRRRAKFSLFTIFACKQPSLRKTIFLLPLFIVSGLLLLKVDDLASEISTTTKTIAGHNLQPTPWHRFPAKLFNEKNRFSKASKLIKCSYLSCLPSLQHQQVIINTSTASAECPSFFRFIYHDLEPWAQYRISESKLMEAKKFAAFRVVIVEGRLYVEHYYACVQTRVMFTIWGLLQLLKRYPGRIPDVDFMFDCMDKPIVSRSKYREGTKQWPPPPLFRYCTTQGHFDIPFPDWSFWGWPETNIEPWDEEFRSIKQGSQAQNWAQKQGYAYWKGNPDVGSAVRKKLLRCNDTNKWGAQILRQNWFKEEKEGYEQSKLANQCKHRYKIYAEGSAWSVSLKYIVSCGSLTLLISSRYEDFFTRGLIPRKNYWPVSPTNNLCRSIKFAVDWGNSHTSEAEATGKAGQVLMEKLSMERVYDYMYHLLNEYAKLQHFKPTPPASAQQVCMESVLCFADPKERHFLENSVAASSPSPPCNLPPADRNLIKSWMQKKRKIITDVQEMEKV